MLSRINSKALAVAVAVLLLAATFFVFQEGPETRTVSAYFDRTVSVYKGSEVRVMGVRIGTVTAVVPEGDRVRVAMAYDEEYKLPADAKAAIVTPTLTADRFVQIAPAYTGGKVLAVAPVRWSVPQRQTNVHPVDAGARANAAGPVTATTASGAPRSYTVARDDLIGDVAARFGVSVKALVWLNADVQVFGDDQYLYEGTTLNLDPLAR